MDYSKFRYEQAKREKENRKNQKQVETKEIRLSVTIDVGDFNTKVNQAKKFLASGHKVKVSIRLKGRMMTHSDLGIENMKRFKTTKSGKVKRAHAYTSHILTKKSTKRKRNLRKTAVADVTNQKQCKRLVPYK